MLNNRIIFFINFLCFVSFFSAVQAQPGISFDLKKPEKYENRKLASEKTEDTKFTIPRKFIQNTVTHYNYYFNANVKLDEVLMRAKADFKDDYSKLLPFYNFNLEGTARYKAELDSVIYKTNNGILLHDLRNSWVDNLYLLMGQAYYFRNQLDTAYFTFQYLNYAFSPKEKDGYDKVIGSNSNEGGTAFSISTNEKRNLVKKATSQPPSRNESLIWIIKTYMANNELPEAAGMIQTLKNDPLFPARLKADLNEVQAYWFYKQEIYDSAAFYLEKALPNAANNQELARWEYLLAQLYNKTAQSDEAVTYFEKSIKHTMDPILEVYARLNALGQNNTTDKQIDNTILELLKMAKKDRYENYRDIIYYAAAQLELKRNNIAAAMALFKKSALYSTNNPRQKSLTYYYLGNLAYDARQYVNAKNYYDSLDASALDSVLIPAFNKKKDGLANVAASAMVIQRQDSLQRIAALPVAQREAFVKKLSKQLRKQQGLKDEETVSAGNNPINNNRNSVPDMFSSNNSSEWYFSNLGLKSKGFTEFQRVWGNRKNTDNWRRLAAVNAGNFRTSRVPVVQANEVPLNQPVNFTSLMQGLPLTNEKLKLSNDSTEEAMFGVAQGLQNKLDDYEAAVYAYEKLLERFPNSVFMPDALFGLYYCYGKLGNKTKQTEAADLLQQKFAGSRYAALASGKPIPPSPDSIKKQEATIVYTNIYNQFIEGKFDAAIASKKTADSVYGKNYWTPQLLYIQAVYHIRQREDSMAKLLLSQIPATQSNPAMNEKAQTLLNVLNKRKQIEDYLTNLKIERPAEDSIVLVNAEAPPGVQAGTPMLQNPATVKAKPVFANKDSAVVKSATPIKQGVDSSKITAAKTITGNVYTHNAAAPQYIALVMDKVDPVYVNEAKNAFARYNREKYYNQPIELQNVVVNDDVKVLVFKQFENAAAAIDYIDRASKLAPIEIIPWLTASKYSFVLISEKNLELLQNNKNIKSYKDFLHKIYPEKF
jgi:tetratricopeptide (TPR) repeat protein